MISPLKSRVLEKMRAGQKAISYKLNLGCPRAAEIAAIGANCDNIMKNYNEIISESNK